MKRSISLSFVACLCSMACPPSDDDSAESGTSAEGGTSTGSGASTGSGTSTGSGASTGSGTPGDSSTGAPGCTATEACETLVSAGFYSELQDCEDWFASGGSEEPVCANFDDFFACACDCVGMSPADAEVCLGQCNQAFCAP